jgi:hypothetical protein
MTNLSLDPAYLCDQNVAESYTLLDYVNDSSDLAICGARASSDDWCSALRSWALNERLIWMQQGEKWTSSAIMPKSW